MIIRGNRSMSPIKIEQNRILNFRIDSLQKENRQLRVQLLHLEQKLLQKQSVKKKYKMKYREAKQKIQILGLLHHYPKSKEQYDCCNSPRTHAQTTRIKTATQSDFASLKAGFIQSQIEDNIPTKHYIPQVQDYYQYFPKKNLTPVTSFKNSQVNREESNLLQSLMSIHEQLQKISAQIQLKNQPSEKILRIQGQLYQKIQIIVDKLNKLQNREIERQNQRISQQKQRNKKRYSSSLKKVQKIGKDLLEFKVQE